MTTFRPRPPRSVPFPYGKTETENQKNWQAVMRDMENVENRALRLEEAVPWINATYPSVLFQNSWADYPADYWTRAQFRRIPDTSGTIADTTGTLGSMVELRGLITGGADNTIAFTLPPGYRPNSDLIFSTEAGGGHARVDVSSAGDVIVRLGSGGGSTGYVGLSRVRFSTSQQVDDGWLGVSNNGVPFENSWTNFGATFNNVEYRLYGTDEVQLRGLAKSGSNGTVMFTLPESMRPALIHHFDADMNSAQHGLVRVLPDGSVYAHGANVGAYISLSGIHFSLSGTGSNGWTSMFDSGVSWGGYDADHVQPEFRVTGDITEVRGLVAGGVGTAFTLPEYAAPATRHLWPVERDGVHDRVDISPDGVITTYNNAAYLSLNAIRFSRLP